MKPAAHQPSMCADWNQLFYDPRKILSQPDPLVAEFCRSLPSGACVLDLGCGAGRHLVYLAAAGMKVFGSDLAPQGLKWSREWLERENLRAHLIQATMDRLPFAEATLAGVISINVLNHGRLEQTTQAVAEVHRLLKPESPFFFVIIGREDARCGEGDEIEPFTFIPHKGIEAGVPHHYFDKTEIERLIAGFQRSIIEQRRRPYDDQDPLFGHDPRLRGRPEAYFHHWVVKAWK